MARITEDLVLLLFDLGSGRALVDSTSLDRAIGGALLLDLSIQDRLAADGQGARARLSVTDFSPTRDSLLDAALTKLGDRQPVRAQKAVELLARKTREPVLERLVERGLMRRERTRLLGFLPATRWPAVDTAAAMTLRKRVAEVLRDGAAADQHIALLISLLHAVKAEHKVVDGPRRELRARAEQVAQGDWAGPAVRKAVQAVQTSVAVAVAASTTAASSSGGS
jgi:Golgi phosphoprotein 3 (GPP34)